MKKHILITVFLCCAIMLNVNAQKKCKFEKIDKETQEFITSSQVKIDTLSRKATLYMWDAIININIAKSNGNFYALMYYQFEAKYDISFLQKSRLDLCLSNGEKVQLFPGTNSYIKNLQTNSTIYYSEGEKTTNTLIEKGTFSPGQIKISGQYNIYRSLYSISPEQMQKLSEVEIESIMFYCSSDTNIKHKQADPEGNYFVKYDLREPSKPFVKIQANCMLAN
jgi:hypothetical protein